MAGSSDTPPFVGDTPPASGDRIAIGGSGAIWGGENESAVDTPDNSLPGAELSPAEAAAEAARREAVAEEGRAEATGLAAVAATLEAPAVSPGTTPVSAEAAAAERVVQGAALAQALSPGVTEVNGVKELTVHGDDGEVLWTGSLDAFLAAQGFVPPKTTAAGLMGEIQDSQVKNVSVDNLSAQNITVTNGAVLSGGKIAYTSDSPKVARVEVDNGTVTVFDPGGQISWQGDLIELAASQVQGAPATAGTSNPAPTGPEALTQGREKTHGEYWRMAEITMLILQAAQDSPNWENLPDGVKVMFFNLAQKSARILTGNPLVPDHYQDIAGYAYLAEQEVLYAISEKDFEDASGTD